MARYRKVTSLIPAENVNMDGIIIKQALPTAQHDQVDPFLLLHHGSLKFNVNAPAKQQGVGPHPHRGFTPVTFVVEGEVHHRDSRGNDQIAGKGEVQWMHAGAGIIHSERPTQCLVDQKGKQEIIQLWINSPAKSKMIPPSYQFFPENEFPYVTSDDASIKSKLIAGKYQGLVSKMKTESELLILWGEGKQGAIQQYKIPTNFNLMVYVIKGKIKVTEYGMIEQKYLLIFDNNSEQIEVTILEDAQFLVLSGKPIEEKVEQYGPFVMNSQTQIMEAMRDYQMGKMGFLVED